MSKLNPDELTVTSFETSDVELSPITTHEPTPNTGCFWCPPETVDGCTF